MTTLVLDWCSYDAAKYACQRWHYSGQHPTGKTAHIGVWEHGDYIGCLLYSRATARQLHTQYNVDRTEICELSRVALDSHDTPVSRMLSISIGLIQRTYSDLRLVVSYADPHQGHDGTVYQAANWIYHGQSPPDLYVKLDGDVRHPRTFYNRYGTQSIPVLKQILGEHRVEGVYRDGKHKYLYPLDNKMRQQVTRDAVPYP
jgi:hypothetical protein